MTTNACMTTNASTISDAYTIRHGNTIGDQATVDWAALLADYLARRPGAAAELVRHASPVVTRAVRSVLSGPDCDDAVQESLLDMLCKAHTVREPAAFPGWISVVAKNAARRFHRPGRQPIPMDDATLAVLAAPEVVDVDAIASRLDAVGLSDALDSLNGVERDVVRLLVAEDGYSYHAVSEQLGCPVGSLGPTRQRALDKLRRHQAVLACALVSA